MDRSGAASGLSPSDLRVSLSPAGSVMSPVRTRSFRFKPPLPIIPHVTDLRTRPLLQIPSKRFDGAITGAAPNSVIMPLPSLTPHDVPVPVPVTFPASPMLRHLSVWNSAVTGRYVPVVVTGQIQDLPRHTLGRNESPRAVVGCGTKPVAPMRTVPGAPEEEDVNGHVGEDIHVGPGYDDDRWRSSNTKEGRKSYVYANIDGCMRLTTEKG